MKVKYLIKNIKLGEKISLIISSGQAKEESLSKKNKYSLEIFRKNLGIINVASADFKLWQLKLCDFFKEPSQREIVLDESVTRERLSFNTTLNRAMDTKVLLVWTSMDALRTFYTR